MRRILLLNTDLEIGGTPTVIRELAIRLRDASDAHIEVACLAKWGPVADQIGQAGICVTALNAAGVFDLSVVGRLVRLIRLLRIDTVFSFLVHANATAAAASLVCSGVRFLQAIQTTQPRPRWHWPVQAAAQYAAEKIIVPSNSVAQAARNRAMVPIEKLIVIPNAIDPPGNAARQGPELLRPIANVGFVGRLDPVKRIPDLLEAMRLVRSAHLHVFGAGPQRPLLERIIQERRLSDRVTLRGSTAGPMEALRKIDLLVLPSEAEGFPLVLIEAMAAGVPIVATDAPGIRDVVLAGKTGLLVPVGSPSELAAAVQSLVNDPARRQRLADAARADVIARFTWERVLPQYLRLLQLTPRRLQ